MNLRAKAIRSVMKHGLASHPVAMAIVDVTLEALAEPDRFMLDGALDELNLAVDKQQHPKGDRHRRDLCAVIWRSMLDRVSL